jgi:membrane protein
MIVADRIRIGKYLFICCAVLALLVLMDTNFLYFVDTSGSFLGNFWSNYRKTLPVFIAFLLFLSTRGVRGTNKFMIIYLLGVCISLIVVASYSHNHYMMNSYIRIFFYTSCNLFVLLAFPLLKLAKKEGGYEAIFRVINVIFCVFYCLLILQSLAYKWGIVFLKVDVDFLRNNNLRMSVKGLGNIMVIYNFCRFFCTKEGRYDKFAIVQFLLGMYCILFVQQTRAMILAILICILAAIIISSKSPLKTYVIIMSIITVFGILYFTGVISSFIDSFGKNSEDYNSTISRLNAYEYFWKAFLKNPLCGHGIITNNLYDKLILGPDELYFYADVGIVGVLAQYGIFTLFIYVLPVLRWGWVILSKIGKFRSNPFPVALFVYILVTTPTLICIAPTFSIVWAICFVVFEYVNVSLKGVV